MVLVVENDPDSLEALATLLQIEGFAVVTSETAERALEGLLAGDRPEAIVLDVWTPGLTATEFLRAKAEQPAEVAAIPVIALSGDPRSLEELEQGAPGGGFAATMRKPFDIDELIEIIRGVVARPVTSPPRG